MTQSTRTQRLVLVIDTDTGLAEVAGRILPTARILTAPNVEDAAETIADEQVDLALLGPSLATERRVTAAGLLRDVDPCLRAVLVADVVTNRLLLASLRSGIVDVVDTPLTETKLAGILDRLPPPGRQSDLESPIVPLAGPPTLIDRDEGAWSSVDTPSAFSDLEVHTDAWRASAVSGPIAADDAPDRGVWPRRVRSIHFEVEASEVQPDSDDLPRTGEARA